MWIAGSSALVRLVALLLVGAGVVQGQGLAVDSSDVQARPVPEAALDRFRADSDFAYDREPPPATSIWDVIGRWINKHVIEPFYDATSQGVRDLLFYGLLGLVVLFALYRLFGANRQGVFSRAADRVPLEGVLAEEGIEAVDLAALADRAVREGRFREAVRLLYLQALQALAARGRIRWTPDKTNRTYLRELSGSGLEGQFAVMTGLFERAWYGSLPVDAGGFEAARMQFRQFHEALEPVHAAGGDR